MSYYLFKQKTAYDLRISDWSSDVCSSDLFGDKATEKVSIFFRPSEMIAFRANANTGFRAPALQQQFFSTVTSQLNAGVLQNVGTFAVNDPVAVALGSSPLRAESSTGISGGVVLTPGGGLTVTVDGYRIDIDDRKIGRAHV